MLKIIIFIANDNYDVPCVIKFAFFNETIECERKYEMYTKIYV